MADSPVHIALALGSNLGDRLGMLRQAAAAVAAHVTVDKKSAIYETPPAYLLDQPAFLNAALTGTTQLAPRDLLQALKRIEKQLGRAPSVQNGPRLIDLDIVFYGDKRMQADDLTLPHPRLAEREFVLRPLADIAGDWHHPVSNFTVEAMLGALNEHKARRIEGGF